MALIVLNTDKNIRYISVKTGVNFFVLYIRFEKLYTVIILKIKIYFETSKIVACFPFLPLITEK